MNGLGISEDQLKQLQQQHTASETSKSTRRGSNSSVSANVAVVKAAARVAGGAGSSKLGGISELAMALQRRKQIASGERSQNLAKPFNP